MNLDYHNWDFRVTNSNTIISYLQEHKQEFDESGIHIIGIFGRVAKNQNTENSDIDILYDTKKF